MNFEYSDKVAGLIAQIEAFMDEHVYPNEQAYYDFVHDQNNRWQEWPGMEALKAAPRNAGLTRHPQQGTGYARTAHVPRPRGLEHSGSIAVAPVPTK